MPAFFYIACADSREIYVGRLDAATGALTVTGRVAVPGSVMPLAVAPGRRTLYAGLRSEPYSVATLPLDPATGNLTLAGTAPLAKDMCYLSVDRTGRWLFGASYSGDAISVNAIGADGLVAQDPVQVLPTDPHPHSIVCAPSNAQVFVPCLGGDVIRQYAFDATAGRLTPHTSPAVEAKRTAGPRHLVFHPSGRFAYCTNELDATVGAYRFDAAPGTLAPVAQEALLPADHHGTPPFAAADIHVTPDGRYLYASERTSSTVTGFSIDAETGALSAAGAVATEERPRGFQIDPSGRYLLAAGQLSDHVTCYAVDARSGVLSARHRVPVGRNPNWVEILDLP